MILGRYDDGTGDGSLGLYKLWVTPPQPLTQESVYTSNGLYYGDRFYELSIDDGTDVIDEFEGNDLVNAHPDALTTTQRVAFLGSSGSASYSDGVVAMCSTGVCFILTAGVVW